MTPNCLRVFKYSTVSLVQRRHGADRLGGERGDRLVGDAFDQREGAPGLAKHVRGLDPHIAQRHFGGAHSVDRADSRARDAGRLGVDHEQADAREVGPAAGAAPTR